MKWLLAATVLALGACDFEFENPHLGVRGLTEDDLNAPPGKQEIRSAVINDIRERRALHLVLDQGRKSPPPEVTWDPHHNQMKRTKDEFPLWRIKVKEDPIEKVHAVFEYAYWDDEQYVYFYHYEGGTPHRDTWLGPFPLKFAKRPVEDEHGH